MQCDTFPLDLDLPSEVLRSVETRRIDTGQSVGKRNNTRSAREGLAKCIALYERTGDPSEAISLEPP